MSQPCLFGAGPHAALRPGAYRALRRTLALHVPAHVVSRCRSHGAAAGALAAAGLRVQEGPEAACVSPSSQTVGQSLYSISIHKKQFQTV